MGTKISDKQVNYSHGPTQTKQQVGQCVIKTLLMHGQAMSKHRLTTFTTAGLGRSHHLPPYSILYAWPWGQHPNVILSYDSKVGSPEIPQIGTIVTLEAHNFFFQTSN